MHPTPRLRKGFDHIGVSACFVAHDGKGNILLMQRSKNARDEHGRWDNIGGGIEFGETIEEALLRECHEELCTEPLDMQFLTVYDAHRTINGERSHWVAVIYAVQVDPTKVKIGEPHKFDDIGWFTSKNLPSPLHSQFYKAYNVALAQGIVK